MNLIRKFMIIATMTSTVCAFANEKIEPPAMESYNKLPWKFYESHPKVKIYTKEVPGSDLIAFKGEMTMKAPLHRILAVMKSPEIRYKWVDRYSGTTLVAKTSSTDFIEQTVIDMPWPMSDRDFVNRTQTKLIGKNLVLIQINSDLDVAEDPEFVRGYTWNSSFSLRAAENNQETHVSVEIFADPMGLLPKSLINLIQKRWPKNTLEAIETVALSKEELSGASALSDLRKNANKGH